MARPTSASKNCSSSTSTVSVTVSPGPRFRVRADARDEELRPIAEVVASVGCSALARALSYVLWNNATTIDGEVEVDLRSECFAYVDAHGHPGFGWHRGASGILEVLGSDSEDDRSALIGPERWALVGDRFRAAQSVAAESHLEVTGLSARPAPRRGSSLAPL